MRVFVCEFVTGGGLCDEPLPPSLSREGQLMRDALVHDLCDLGLEVLTTHDVRTRPPFGADSLPVTAGDDVWSIWAGVAATADVAWLIAPETAGLLARLTRLARGAGATVVGPDDDTIRIASSKSATVSKLAPFVLTPATWAPGAVPRRTAGPFVAKPDCGAGCEATLLFDAVPKKSELPKGHIVQRFVAGEPASLTVLRANGRTRLLCANRQRVVVENGVFRFRGVGVAAVKDQDGRLAATAEAVVAALPGLAGIFGIDIVLGADGPVVIEVNPRLTTAYAGLRDALGLNPASLAPPFAPATAASPSLVPRHVEIAL
ncbi:ATP-grasp domain-containing protein [Methylopila sp. M107]|uniref:ATP-grasp domain-containing protein n=1 Tax=Methylopila sp. M107 TaxID=1101190 RepID=UPI00036B7E99|nr:ATP-grasp domain-containing protein [Methylopila sp. M107]